MKNSADGNAKGSVAVVAMMSTFLNHRRDALRFTVRTSRLATPMNSFQVSDAIQIRRKSTIDFNNVHERVSIEADVS